MHYCCYVVLANDNGLDCVADCSFSCHLTRLLLQHWRSMVIAPDTKTLEWSFGFLFFYDGNGKCFRCHSMIPHKHSTGCWWLRRRSCYTDNIMGISIQTTLHALVLVWQLHHHRRHHPIRQCVGKHSCVLFVKRFPLCVFTMPRSPTFPTT